ncbi:MFS transporter [Oxalobacter vibrioformis]|uniref:MFS transporter n=1 Tax=Oxalobacter vibrioformis TaxID=933080 RepID=A0A9E9LVT9_9BURK|nr:MFS transporter [Oxalobacter vibrioformis]WAW09647.1 MFS transporter [Oxalobacter vibrioformis]
MGTNNPTHKATSAGAGITRTAHGMVLPVLVAVTMGHLINDLIQAVLPAIYPMLKVNYHLSFFEIGIITLVYQVSASLLQPLIGWYSDRRPQPWLLPAGMVSILAGVVLLAYAQTFPLILVASTLIGIGSSTFHPEGSRVALMSSPGRFGLAQSTFQVGGNAGSALGPLLAAAVVIPFGQTHVVWFALPAVVAIVLLHYVSRWYSQQSGLFWKRGGQALTPVHSRQQILLALGVLGMLVFSKYVYMASLHNFLTFYMMERFQVSIGASQIYLFLFLGAVAAGTFLGGPIGDRLGRKAVIWFSILGAAPFALILPYADLFWTAVLTVVTGFILASAFSAIIVYAQELIPGNPGLIAGGFFGLMFGIGGIAAVFLGWMADLEGIVTVYRLCAFLPLLGILTIFLPSQEKSRLPE